MRAKGPRDRRTPLITFAMGKQYNKVIKRKRRAAYVARKDAAKKPAVKAKPAAAPKKAAPNAKASAKKAAGPAPAPVPAAE
jgi:hypothetical protein